MAAESNEISLNYNFQSTVFHLKELCRSQGLPVSGNKSTLIARLDENLCRSLQEAETLHDHSTINQDQPDYQVQQSTRLSQELGTQFLVPSINELLNHEQSEANQPRVTYNIRLDQLENRIERALSQRLYLIDYHREGNVGTFRVLGSTGNMYKVTISNKHQCDCPDPFPICKHIIFVLCRVLRVSRNSYVIQKMFLTDDNVESLLQKYCTFKDIQANKKVLNYINQSSSNLMETNRKPVDPTDDCPICFEPLEGESLVWCESTCGNNIHKECMNHWISQVGSHGTAKCPLCRADWVSESSYNSDGNYTNLSHLTGQSKTRTYGRSRRTHFD